MFIGSCKVLEIGAVYKGIYDTNKVHHPNQPFKVLRIATYKEYEDNVRQNNPNQQPGPDGYNYYEISLD